MTENGQSTLGRRLRVRRAELGLTLEQLAEHAGVSVRAISDIERGRTAQPRRVTVRLLAGALGLDDAGRPAAAATAPPGDGPGRPAGPQVAPPAPVTAPVDGTIVDGLAVPRQLPAAARGFAGRAAELSLLTGLLDQAAADGGPAVVTIGGMAGVGKTALALHWAHQAASRFPDGQLYLDLRGFGPAGPPADPADAVCCFLEALGVPSARIPVRADAQTGLYRSLLAQRRVLILLDNASDASQVRPLLPGGPGCLALVTSRGQLTGLAVAPGARPVPLQPLGPAEARDLLALRLGAARLDAEPEAAARLIELTAGLPLALSITAARAAAHPAATLAGVAAELSDVRGRLGGLDGGDAAADVRAAFSWSYRRLAGPAARLFRLLSVHPGPDISLAAVASLAGCDLDAARQALAELTAGGLVTEPAPGRYGCHDLLRGYAAELSQAGHGGPAGRNGDGTAAARIRMLDHYLHTSHAAMLRLEPVPEPLPLPPRQPGTQPEQPVTEPEAQHWFRTEHGVLLAVAAEAARTGHDQHAWLLPATMTTHLLSSSRWHEWAANQRAGLAAAQRLGDELAQARAHRGLGNALA